MEFFTLSIVIYCCWVVAEWNFFCKVLQMFRKKVLIFHPSIQLVKCVNGCPCFEYILCIFPTKGVLYFHHQLTSVAFPYFFQIYFSGKRHLEIMIVREISYIWTFFRQINIESYVSKEITKESISRNIFSVKLKGTQHSVEK